jgi:hypothetical protein
LTAIRENERNQTSSKFTLEQTLLMPTIMLASAYDRWLWSRTDVGGFGNEIQSLQKMHIDNLALSGNAWVPTLQKELERLNVFQEIMTEVDPNTHVEQDEKLTARKDDAGQYGMHNRQRDDGKDVDTMEL